MCGIFFSLCRHEYLLPDNATAELLNHRGPDSLGTQQVAITVDSPTTSESATPGLHATFVSTVLSLRGSSVTEQPLTDSASGSILCWNGEAWTIHGTAVAGNDSQHALQALLDASRTDTARGRLDSRKNVIDVLSSIRGPYALVFYDAVNRYLYFGRDCLGRRSLLRKRASNDQLILSSVCDCPSGENWEEVEADGIQIVDLERSTEQALSITHVPHKRDGESMDQLYFNVPFPAMNCSISPDPNAHPDQEVVGALDESLRRSLALRAQHVREADNVSDIYTTNADARVAILFSGGLDCTILARLTHDLLPLEQSVDLVNVAFENPRIHGKLGPEDSPYELCPDRITGRTSHRELTSACPGRIWRFVEVNVPYDQTVAHRTSVMTLMHPHNTEMDLSISYALYFASRGCGRICDSEGSFVEYDSPAHVLLSGLGADELFGGYQRHAVAFNRQGYPGLVQELELDFNRLGKRNLGRDDRVISDSGKEVRFPYLDEDFIALALRLPVTSKCDFGNGQEEGSDDPAKALEPGKRALRLLAWHLGMRTVAAEKKRAIQFGSRTAKMETGKTKGTHVLS